MDFSALLKEKMNLEEKIIGKQKYYNSAVIVLIVKIKEREYVIFQKRASNIRQGGEVSFPGGKVENSDKTTLETALRECYEEMGIVPNEIEILGKIGTHIIPIGTLVEAYVGRITEKTFHNIKLNEDEVEKFFLVPLKFFIENKPRIERLQTEINPCFEANGELYLFPAKELQLPERYHQSWKSSPREVYLYIYEKEVIWGITADIMYELLRYLK